MPSETGTSGGLMRRLGVFYVILAAIAVAVVIFVVDRGKNEKAQPAIAGVYQSAALNSCIGPAPKPVGGAPLPATAPTQVPAPGPTFNVLQSGQFVNFTNNQGTLGGKLRLNEKTLANGGHQLTGNVECVNGGSKAINAIATPGAKASIAGTLGGASFVANFKSGPPAAGAPAPRTPVNLKGTYTTTPTSTCLGGKFALSGSAPTYGVSWNGEPLGTVTYSDTTGAVAGDIACARGGTARSPRRRTTAT